jgi:hypothetical protein
MYIRQLHSWAARLVGVFGREARDRELAEELESHLQMHVEDNIKAGLSPDEARRQAVVKLGGVEQTKEKYRRQRGMPIFEDMWQDLRFGARVLLKQPSFTLVAVLTLALGIGANTALFSVVNAVLLRPLPFHESDRIVALYETFQPSGHSALSVPNLRDWQQQNTVFQDIAAYVD